MQIRKKVLKISYPPKIKNLKIIKAVIPSMEYAFDCIPNRLLKYDKGSWWTYGPYSGAHSVVTYEKSIMSWTAWGNERHYIRPLLEIADIKSAHLKIGDSFKFGGVNFKIIYDNAAFCEEDVGESDFLRILKDGTSEVILEEYINQWFDEKNIK